YRELERGARSGTCWAFSCRCTNATCHNNGCLLLLIPGWRLQLDQVIDAQNGNSRLGRRPQRLDFDHRRLQHASAPVVADAAVEQVQSRPKIIAEAVDDIRQNPIEFSRFL